MGDLILLFSRIMSSNSILNHKCPPMDIFILLFHENFNYFIFYWLDIG
jgi:hypothetical protein